MSLNIACFCMMRNESPILGPFLDQLTEFFDKIYLVDHSSTDRSVSLVLERNLPKIELYQLLSNGYPQSQLATHFVKKAFQTSDVDYIFFLDCDEFLPFVNRSALEAFLLDNSPYDVIEFSWLNLCPAGLDGGDIFSKPFLRSENISKFVKIALSRKGFEKAPNLKILQGYHGLDALGQVFELIRPNETHLYHIPVRSRVQIAFKLVSGHNRLVTESGLLKSGNGTHWRDLAEGLRYRRQSDRAIVDMALNYPDVNGDAGLGWPLGFDFPYVQSKYREDSEYVMMSAISLLSNVDEKDIPSEYSITLIARDGEVELSELAESTTKLEVKNMASKLQSKAQSMDGESQVFSSLYEPLFSLPTKMPLTAWSGHIPFLFVLFKLLRPKTYVELGVHNGASFIAACTAAKQYQTGTQLFGVDCWFGDEHAGHYEGDQIYDDLRAYLERTFDSAELIRSYFHEAHQSFASGSIDILHIDGLHTYEAVKQDYKTWLTTMSPTGVILFHDTNVHDRGFGVHRLWKELSSKYSTLEFFHSHGLGVLFLDPLDVRIDKLSNFFNNPEQWYFYRDLVALIAQSLPDRMEMIDSVQRTRELQETIIMTQGEIVNRDREIQRLKAENSALLSSTSWRITRPLRSLMLRLRNR